MINLLIINEENFIPNNNYDMPIIGGEIAPVLGSYVPPTPVVGAVQIAFAYVS